MNHVALFYGHNVGVCGQNVQFPQNKNVNVAFIIKIHCIFVA